MAKLITLQTFSSDTGNLTVFEKILPGVIKRVFYIYGAGQERRAGHRHKQAWNALICLHGQCRVYSFDGNDEQLVVLNDPRQCLILEPADWHVMDAFSDDAVLLVLSNEYYDKDDYIREPYTGQNELITVS